MERESSWECGILPRDNLSHSIIEVYIIEYSAASLRMEFQKNNKTTTSFRRRPDNQQNNNAFCSNPLDSGLRRNDGMCVANCVKINKQSIRS